MSLDNGKDDRVSFSTAVQNSSAKLKKAKRNVIAGMVTLLFFAVGIGVVGIITNQQTTTSMIDLHEGLLDMRREVLQLNSDVLRIYVAMRDLALCEAYEKERIAEIEQTIEEEKKRLAMRYAVLANANIRYQMFETELKDLDKALREWEPISNKNIYLAKNGYMKECRISIRTAEAAAVREINESTDSLVAAIISEGAKASDYAEARAQRSYLLLGSTTMAAFLVGVFITMYQTVTSSKAIRIVDKTQREFSRSLEILVEKDRELRKSLEELDREVQTSNKMRERYIESLEAANDVIFEAKTKDNSFFASNKWPEIINRPIPTSFAKEDILQGVMEDDWPRLMEIMKTRTGHFEIECRFLDADNKMRWIRIKCRWMEDSDGQNHRLMGSLSDITQSKMTEQKMAYLAKNDALTNLPNRISFAESLQSAILQAKVGGTQFAVLILDLDDFKEINDTHGHSFGDELLKVLAERFKELRQSGMEIARFGGDEFLFLITGLTEASGAYKIAENMRVFVKKPIVIAGVESCITCSIGAVVFPHDGENADTLLKNVDSAMYESKKAGGDKVSFYNRAMSEMLVRKTKIGAAIRTALEKRTLSLAYQPQYNLATKKIESMEALLRLEDGVLGPISPAEFIPIAEATQLIVPLGYWVIGEAIRCEQRLREQGILLNNVSVNISEIQLREPNFISTVRQILRETGYVQNRLHFEITESVFLNDIENKVMMFEELKCLGIKIELDDFGTGYSSLNYLRLIPLDVIKIDKCFVDEIGHNTQQEALLELIVNLCKINNAVSIAEGVETLHQVQFLQQKGTTLLQGYYYSKPLQEKVLAQEIGRINKVEI